MEPLRLLHLRQRSDLADRAGDDRSGADRRDRCGRYDDQRPAQLARLHGRVVDQGRAGRRRLRGRLPQ